MSFGPLLSEFVGPSEILGGLIDELIFINVSLIFMRTLD